MLEKLKEQYENQDNRATAWPIYVVVQELIPVGVIADDYSVIGEGETITEYPCEICCAFRQVCTHACDFLRPEHILQQ